MKQRYFEGVNGRLIPVINAEQTGPYNVTAEVKKDEMGYKKGEILSFFKRHLVEKAGTRQGFILVRTVTAPMNYTTTPDYYGEI